MSKEKLFLHSKTIIAAILMLIVQLGPMLGISFGEDDAAVVNQHVDTILTSILALIAMYGRVNANSTIVFRSNRTNSPWFVPIIALLVLMGCENVTTPQTPQQSYYATKAAYAVAKEEAAAYALLPFCSDVVVVYCANPEIVVKLDDVADKADEIFAEADAVFALATANPLEQETALDAATVALRQLTAILALAVVAEAA